MGLQIRTNHLRQVLEGELRGLCPLVYYRKAKNAAGDHIVFALSDYDSFEDNQQIQMEVRVIGRGGDTSKIEDLADSVWAAFDHMYYIDDELEFHSYRNTRSVLDDEDASVICRRLLIDIRAY